MGAVRIFRYFSRPNPQCTVGALFGILSFSLTWIQMSVPSWYLHFHYYDPNYNLFEVILVSPPEMSFYCLLFLIGSIVAIITPLGGIAQSCGLLGFILSLRYFATGYEWSAWSRLYEYSYSLDAPNLGAGYFLAVTSCVLVITSVNSVISSANGGRPVRALSRFAALTPSAFR